YLLKRRLFNLFYVVEIDGVIIGFIICVPKSDTLYEIFTLNVHPEWRKKGLGTSLMLKIEEIISTSILKVLKEYPDSKIDRTYSIELVVYEKNIAALELYKKLGYQIVENLKNYYRFNRHGIKMRKEISLDNNEM
ncbi:MAG: GNAT family N-acetyltransferase, partial [Candidatus Thorarchaeota archaeon]